MIKPISNYLKVFILASVFIFVGLIRQGSASAAIGLSTTFPDPGSTTIDGVGPKVLYLTVGEGDFSAHSAGASIISDTTGSFTLTVDHAAWCNDDNATLSGNQSIDLPSQFAVPYRKTTFGVYAVNGTSADTYTLGTNKASYTTSYNESCTTQDITLSFTIGASDYKSSLGKYVVLAFGSQLFQPANPAYGTTIPSVSENSFRFLISGPAGSNVGMTIAPPSSISGSYFNFSNRNRSTASQLSSSIYISTPCSLSSQNVQVRFFDTDDADNYRSSIGSLQSSSSYNFPLNFNVQRSPKGSTSFTDVSYSYTDDRLPFWGPLNVTGARKVYGGQKEESQVFNITLSRDYVYRFTVSGLSQPNAVSFKFNTNIDPLFTDVECDKAPAGVLDSVSCSTIQGWAFDPDSSASSITVHVYEGGGAGVGTFVGGYSANVLRTDVNAYFGISGNHGFIINVPAKYKDGSAHTFYVYALGIDSGGTQNGNNPQITSSPKTTEVCPISTLTCSFTYPVSGAALEPDISVAPVMSISRSSGSGTTTVTPSASIGTTTLTPSPSTVSLTDTTTTGSVTFSSKSFTDVDVGTGSFTVSGSISWDGRSATCTSDFSIVRKPTFTVSNGDMAVGGNYGSGASCGSMGTGNVAGWADVASPSTWNGSNSELVAKFFGSVLEFYSGSTIKSSSNSKKFLTLSNNTSQEWGGGFAAGTCMTDFYSYAPTAATLSASYTPSGSGKVSLSGNVTINSATGLTGNLTVFVNGNVSIPGNITTSTSYPLDANGSPTIPTFTLVVKGNIYVGSNVSTLDGIYVARSNGATGGTIFTCSSGFAAVSASNLYSTCSRALTFNGIVQTENIKLLRTISTLSKPATTAEQFIGLPELYLIDNPFSDSANNTYQYDSAASLPPLL